MFLKMRTWWNIGLLLLVACTTGWAQESPLHAELRREGERVSDACLKLVRAGEHLVLVEDPSGAFDVTAVDS